MGDAAALKLRKFGGGFLNSLIAFLQIAFFATGSSFFIKGMGDKGLCTVHPGVFPSNLMYHNTSVSKCKRFAWKFVSLLLLMCTALICVGLFFAANTIPAVAAIQTVLMNEIVTRIVEKLIRKQRLYLRTAMNDAVCVYVFFMITFNVFSFAFAGNTVNAGSI